MKYGTVWREGSPQWWDHMFSTHKASTMTRDMLARVGAHKSVCEVGCGHGHFLGALLKTGWSGRYVGFDMSPSGVKSVQARCAKAGIDYDAWAGDFLEHMADPQFSPPQCDVVVSRDVVIHQPHWMPMVAAMLRIAPVVLVGIGYVSTTGFHEGELRSKGHYDVRISPPMMELEAAAAGMRIQIHPHKNLVRKKSEMLAIVESP